MIEFLAGLVLAGATLTPDVLAPPPPPPRPAAAATAPLVVHPASAGEPTDADFDRLALCESKHHGLWQANTGNGYYGGLQFDASTWRSVGGVGLPHHHPREVQIEMGRRLWRKRGWAPWPSCRRQLRLG